MDDGRQCIDGIAVQENVKLHEARLAIVGKLVVERGITARRRFQAIKVVVDDLAQRDVVDDHDAVRIEVVHTLERAALFLRDFHDGADIVLRHDDRRFDKRLLDEVDLRRRRKLRRIVDLEHRPVRLVDVVDDGGRRRDELHAVLAL